MKITSISCDQFAGIRDKKISLKGGINVICGENESGKSTAITLLSRTLFQKTHLDKRSDKAFIENCFPSDKKGGSPKGDCIDGKVVIEYENNKYTLSKEWGEGSAIKLITADGTTVKKQETIDEIMKGILVYGEGVYSDILFSTQYNTSQSLKTILDSTKSSSTKDELNSTMSRALAESDNISIDKIEKSIAERIAAIEGEHWDRAGGKPAKKTGGGNWSKGLGEILKAYYDVDAAEEKLRTIAAQEREVIATAEAYDAILQAYQTAEKKHSDFLKFSGDIKLSNELTAKERRLEKDIFNAAAELKAWPETISAISVAEKLKNEHEARQTIDSYNSAKAIFDKITALKAEIKKATPPTDEEIEHVRKAEREAANLENKLKGMNLSACIKLFGGNKAQVKVIRTGEIIDITDENISIDEAVVFSIPGVMEMTLSPNSVNSEEIGTELSRIKADIGTILKKYSAKNLDELVRLSEYAKKITAECKASEGQLAVILGKNEYEALKKQALSITGNIRSAVEIAKDINEYCGGDASRFIYTKTAIVDGYEKAHQSIENLEKKLETYNEELKETKTKLSEIKEIPKEYFTIDVDSYVETLKKAKQDASIECNEALSAKTSAQSKLDSTKEELDDDPREAFEKAKERFSEKKSELESWLYIQQAFFEQKSNLSGNPTTDIADKFAEYLGIISENTVSADFASPDKLDMEIYSGNNHITYDMLSEGTKDTVSLAFRLSVLEHLFPDGGGVIVLDDPFTDMDEKRTKKACELVKKCAERHQVIFLTCKKEIADMLSGNLIEFDE